MQILHYLLWIICHISHHKKYYLCIKRIKNLISNFYIEERTLVYADEFYKPSQLFEYFYGDGERP